MGTTGTACLMLRERLLTLHRAEQHRRRCWEKVRKRTTFINNPFGFTRQLLGQRPSGRLTCSEEEVDQHSDPTSDQDLGQCEAVIKPPEPTEAFDLREPLLKVVQDVVRKARTKQNILEGVQALPQAVTPGLEDL